MKEFRWQNDKLCYVTVRYSDSVVRLTIEKQGILWVVYQGEDVLKVSIWLNEAVQYVEENF